MAIDFSQIGSTLTKGANKMGGYMEKTGEFMKKNPELTKGGMAAASSIGSGIRQKRAANQLAANTPPPSAGADPMYMMYLNDIKRRRMAYQSGAAYAPERQALSRNFAQSASTIRKLGGGSGASVGALRRMMTGVTAGLADVKSKTGAAMEANLLEQEGAAVDTITGRSLELDLLGRSKEDAQIAAAAQRGEVSAADRTAASGNLSKSIAGIGKLLSGLGKKDKEDAVAKTESDVNELTKDDRYEDTSFNKGKIEGLTLKQDTNDYPLGEPDYRTFESPTKI